MIDRKKGRVSTFQFFISHQGGEFMSTVFKNFLRKKGIQHMVGPPNTPQYFSIVERANRTINIGEMAKATRKFAMIADMYKKGALQSQILEILCLVKYKLEPSLICLILIFWGALNGERSRTKPH